MPQCPVGIIAILPRDLKTVDGHDYGAILYSPLGPGVSTGTFWVNASGNAYHVAFTERKVLSKTLAGDIDVVNFRLPVDAHLENAFVDELEGGETSTPGGCRLLDAWFPRLNEFLPGDAIGRFRTGIRRSAAAPIDAAPITDPDAQCMSPNLQPTTLAVVAPRTPSRPRVRHTVNVVVRLGADSSVLAMDASAEPDLTLAAASVGAASHSLFRTEIKNCRPLAATYVFSVEYFPS